MNRLPPALMSALLVTCLAGVGTTFAAEPRARDLGVPFDGTPGPLNAITDVSGVTVGQVTLIEDLDGGRKVRTGITAILPRGRLSLNSPVYGGWFALNGNGEMTGTTYLDELGQIDGPIMLTNTHSVGVVHDAVIAWRVRAGPADASGYWWSSPVVAETWDGDLNDINGFHVRAEHADRALDSAQGGPVAEGNVGGGTGMVCHEFKCGIGTASRRVEDLRPRVLGGRARAGQLRRPRNADDRRRAGRQASACGCSTPTSLERRFRIDHRGACHRRATAPASAQARRTEGRARTGAHGQLRRQRFR